MMKTTVDLPDELYRRAKAEAALRGRKFRDLVTEGLVRVLDQPSEEAPRTKLADLMKRARGVIDSGVPDLATNPRHLAGFGRRARNR
jgi:hypothetical protein